MNISTYTCRTCSSRATVIVHPTGESCPVEVGLSAQDPRGPVDTESIRKLLHYFGRHDSMQQDHVIALCDEVDRLRAELAAAEEERDKMTEWWRSQRDRARGLDIKLAAVGSLRDSMLQGAADHEALAFRGGSTTKAVSRGRAGVLREFARHITDALADH